MTGLKDFNVKDILRNGVQSIENDIKTLNIGFTELIEKQSSNLNETIEIKHAKNIELLTKNYERLEQNRNKSSKIYNLILFLLIVNATGIGYLLYIKLYL